MQKLLEQITDLNVEGLKMGLIALIDKHYWVATAAVAALSFYILLNLHGSLHGFAQLVGWLGFRGRKLAFTVTLALLSAVSALLFTDNMRRSGIPVPNLIDRAEVVFREEKTLQWEPVATRPDETVHYQIQWSPDPSFPRSDARHFETADTVIPLRVEPNRTLYWRVRAVLTWKDPGRLLRHGPWTEPIRIEHYDSAYERIRHTQRLMVGLERSYGRSFMRFLWPFAPDDGAQNISYRHRGLEPELVYAFADALCQEFFAGRTENGERLRCVSSREPPPRNGDCAPDQCRRIEVRFVPMEKKDLAFKAVGEGVIDLAISTFVAKPERSEKFHIQFSRNSYLETRFAFVYDPARNPAPVFDLQGLTGKKIMTEQENAAGRCLNEIAAAATVNGQAPFQPGVFDSFHQAPNLLRTPSGPDFIMTNEPFAAGWSHRYGVKCARAPAALFASAKTDYCQGLPYRVAARAGETRLLDLVDREIARENKNAGRENSAKSRAWRDYKAYMKSLGRPEPGIGLCSDP